MTTTFLASLQDSLPPGVTIANVAAVLIPVGIVTVLLRALPFGALAKVRTSKFAAWLSVAMPVGILGILVIYAVRGGSSAPGGIGGVLLVLVFTVALHLWRKDAMLSILAGTLVYVLLTNLVW